MNSAKYIYNVNYQIYEKDLCEFERRILFNNHAEDKVFLSNKKITPQNSIFVKNRIEIIYAGASLQEILEQLIEDDFTSEEFLVTYLNFESNERVSTKGKKISKAIGMVMAGYPNFESPKNSFAITCHQDYWYFGLWESVTVDWEKHKAKPRNYSSSISINIAKTVVHISGADAPDRKLIDPCCGVGTILFEAYDQGYSIIGRDINEKISEDARINLKHFGYDIEVTTGDIKDVVGHYDVSIVDLPYGISSKITEDGALDILREAKRFSYKMVFVSSVDIESLLGDIDVTILDRCRVQKTHNSKFSRYIWYCTKE